jgi:hypothetical protein
VPVQKKNSEPLEAANQMGTVKVIFFSGKHYIKFYMAVLLV